MGRNIVVAAAGRKLGKTFLAAALARVLSEGGFSVAFFKLRRHDKGGVEYLPGPGGENSDTWRLNEAGACEVGFLSFNENCDVTDCLPEAANGSDVVIWETNSAAGQIPGAVVVYIDGEVPDPKNPELADSAVIHVKGPVTFVSSETSGLILSTAGLPGFNPVRPGWKLWLELDSGPVFGGGIASLLEKIRESGSILAASKATGIQYRRVWTLISKTEAKLGVRLIHRSRGGSGGGGSSLTPVAEMMLKRFHFLEDAMASAASKLEENHQ